MRKVKLTVDPSRAAVAALERIKSVLERSNKGSVFGPPTTMRELAARANFAGRPLPPSYVAALRVTSAIGEPEELLDANEMDVVNADVFGPLADRKRYIPFCRSHGGEIYYCFDAKSGLGERPRGREDEELSVVEWQGGTVRTSSAHFGEWIDAIADEREEALAKAANLPKSLRDLLLHLGFRFEDPIVGTLHTSDVAAIETLLGETRSWEARGSVSRLFDASGKALLRLNLDEFVLSVTLRSETLRFEAEDVFRWLRTFRDENFFDTATFREPSHPDQVRDLRKAPREAPLIVRGALEVGTLPSERHFFCDASGPSPDDYHLLGRGAGSRRATSLILHVVAGEVRDAHTFGQPLHAIYATESGILWGVSNHGHVIRFAGGEVRSFPLPRAAGSLTWWYGIGEWKNRVIVWGTGALLEFDGNGFVPFRPDAQLETHEAVVALCTSANELSMLVCGDQVGAVARFDGRAWAPIAESHVLEADLVDYDVWRGVGIVLARGGGVWRVEGVTPHPVPWDAKHDAFCGAGGQARRIHGVRGFDGGALLASDGGVIAIGAGEPVFHGAPGAAEPARLARVGKGDGAVVIATFGAHVWVWSGGAFQPFDVRAW